MRLKKIGVRQGLVVAAASARSLSQNGVLAGNAIAMLFRNVVWLEFPELFVAVVQGRGLLG